ILLILLFVSTFACLSIFVHLGRQVKSLQKPNQPISYHWITMALQWMILTYVVAAEAAIALLLTMPSPKALKSSLVSLISLILQPSMFIVPFAGFQLLDIYWKNEHRLMCSGETCTTAERDRYERSIYKAQRNVYLSCLQVLQGDSEYGGSRKEVQGRVEYFHRIALQVPYLYVVLVFQAVEFIVPYIVNLCIIV
ncbi:hypothetical protein Ccrd_013764, partial [Cynara cardunculus var. scolymus]